MNIHSSVNWTPCLSLRLGTTERWLHHRTYFVDHLVFDAQSALRLSNLLVLSWLLLNFLLFYDFDVLKWEVFTQFVLIPILNALLSILLEYLEAVPKHIALGTCRMLNGRGHLTPRLLDSESHWFVIVYLVLEYLFNRLLLELNKSLTPFGFHVLIF